MAEKGIVHSLLAQLGALLLALPIGVALCLASIFVLFSNEGRAVKTRNDLAEGVAAVVSIPSKPLPPTQCQRLVHVQGRATTDEILRDPFFKVSARALRLSRTVEMYQWSERVEHRRDSLSRKRSTHYHYEQKWSSDVIDASKFHQSGYENPATIPYTSDKWSAQKVNLGAFRLRDELVEEIVDSTPLTLTNIPPELAKAGFKPLTYSYYRGENQLRPQIGDVRITFMHVEPQDVTVVAAQDGDTLKPYPTKRGGTIAMVRTGHVSAKEMFEQAQWWNEVKMWLIRIGGVFLMIFGVQLTLRPIAVLESILPTFVSWISFAAGFLGFILALAAALVVISIAWVAYRPIIAIPVLVAGVLTTIAILHYSKRRASRAVRI